MKLFSRLLFPVFLPLAASLSSYGALVTTIESSSDAERLDLSVSGTVEASEFGNAGPNNTIYFYSPGVSWRGGTDFNNYPSDITIGASNDGPEISGSTPYYLKSASVFSGTEDVIEVQNFVESFGVGDSVDWSFSVQNFNEGNLDFTPLLSQSTLNTQIGAGTQTIPEPSAMGLIFGTVGMAAAVFGRRRRSGRGGIARGTACSSVWPGPRSVDDNGANLESRSDP